MPTTAAIPTRNAASGATRGETLEALFAFSNRVCSPVQRGRPARPYSATKPRRNPSKSFIASIRQNVRRCLWSMAMSSKPDPKLGAGKSRCWFGA